MICCSGNCERSSKCGKYIHNLSMKYRKEHHTVESLDSFGWGSISMNGCEVHTWCGYNGNYAMYEPIDMESVKDD